MLLRQLGWKGCPVRRDRNEQGIVLIKYVAYKDLELFSCYSTSVSILFIVKAHIQFTILQLFRGLEV